MSYRLQILNPTVKDNVQYFDSIHQLQAYVNTLEFPHRVQKDGGDNWDELDTQEQELLTMLDVPECVEDECRECGLPIKGAFECPNGCLCGCHPENQLVNQPK